MTELPTYLVKTVVVDGTSYSINLNTDISNSVPIDAPILMGIYDPAGVSILTDATVNTHNNTTINIYSSTNNVPNDTLAITLCTKTHNVGTNRYDIVPVPQDIRLDAPYFQCNVLDTTDSNSGVLSISCVQNDLNNLNSVTTPTTFVPTSTYSIQIDFNILLGIIPALPANIAYINFITDIAPIDAGIIKQFSDMCNNMVFKLNNLDTMDNVRNCFSNNTNPLDYQFTPVTANENGFAEDASDANGNNVVLQFNITSMLQNLYIKQYLSEYTQYFDTLDMALQDNFSQAAADMLSETKISMLYKSNLLNSFAKCTLKGMNSILGLFCQNLGQYTFRVEESPENSNFIYRVTSDMPRVYWTSIVKDIIHPISWRDEYIEIDNGRSNLATTSATVPAISVERYQDYGINLRDRTIRLNNMIGATISIPTTYLDVLNNAPYSGDTRYYDAAMMGGMDSTNKFSFNPNTYDLTLNYVNNAALIAELDAAELNVELDMDAAHNVRIMNVEYMMTGVALEYHYVIKCDGVVSQKLRSFTPTYRCQLAPTVSVVDVAITLVNDVFRHTVTKTITIG